MSLTLGEFCCYDSGVFCQKMIIFAKQYMEFIFWLVIKNETWNLGESTVYLFEFRQYLVPLIELEVAVIGCHLCQGKGQVFYKGCLAIKRRQKCNLQHIKLRLSSQELLDMHGKGGRHERDTTGSPAYGSWRGSWNEHISPPLSPVGAEGERSLIHKQDHIVL